MSDSSTRTRLSHAISSHSSGAGAMRIGGYVTEMHLDGVRSAEGEKLLHPEVYATLNVLP